ncbi:hypothetical protein XELAEV_18030254mg [Xenopus laevis]|uniref:Uncharacterized protein n=1 Tax=Xenopus laevis TaxID=8355 RepID=A0A974CUT6_XENLA|nr:hypothetical protein XELAEV_18030254mg [Xenopus laevis]
MLGKRKARQEGKERADTDLAAAGDRDPPGDENNIKETLEDHSYLHFPSNSTGKLLKWNLPRLDRVRKLFPADPDYVPPAWDIEDSQSWTSVLHHIANEHIWIEKGTSFACDHPLMTEEETEAHT